METLKKTLLSDYLPSEFLIDQIHLHFELAENETEVKAITHFFRNPSAKKLSTNVVLNGEDMQLTQIFIDGKSLSPSDYKVEDAHLTIFSVPDTFTLETHVKINPAANKKLSGLFQSRGNYCTQCEPHGFRRITYSLDRPDIMTKFTTTISADKTRYPYLLSNGNLI
jgi:aminopeptidase N